MKLLLVIVIAVSILASCATPKPASQKMNLASLVGGESSRKIVSAVPLGSRDPFGNPWFEPIAPPITDSERLAHINHYLLNGKVYEIGETPFIGQLCHVALLSSSKDVVAIVSIINSESRCIIGEASRDSLGRIRFDSRVERVAVQSDEFVRMIYDHLKSTAPGYLDKQRKLYGGIGHTIDLPALITNPGERDVADQRTAGRE